MPEEEKAQYDIKRLANIFFKAMVGMALIIIAGILLSNYLDNESIEEVALFISLGIGLPYLLINANSSKNRI